MSSVGHYQSTTLKTKDKVLRKGVLDSITSDDDVYYYWSFVSQDIDDEDASQELLYEIASLWVTIRGFSLASTWLEQYKCATKSTVAVVSSDVSFL